MKAQDFTDLPVMAPVQQRYEQAGIEILPIIDLIISSQSPEWRRQPAAAVAWQIATELLHRLDQMIEERKPRTRVGKLIQAFFRLFRF